MTNDFQWLSIAECYEYDPELRDVVSEYPQRYNVIAVPRGKRYHDGRVETYASLYGRHEHVEHVTKLARGGGVPPQLAQVMSEALAGCELPLSPGYRLKNQQTGEIGEFVEWALNEMEIHVRVVGERFMQTWSLEAILVSGEEVT